MYFNLRFLCPNLGEAVTHVVVRVAISSSGREWRFRRTFVRQEAPFARDLSKAARDLTTFEEANASRAKTPRVQCQSAADAGLFALALTEGWALAAV